MMPMRIIGHGIDLVEISRVEQMLAAHGQRFVDRCFTGAEQAYSESGPRRRAERYAARLACKEAVMKALGTGWRSGIAWTQIEVVHDPSGQPQIRLSGRCQDLAADQGIEQWHVSLSHTGLAAIASVLACGPG